MPPVLVLLSVTMRNLLSASNYGLYLCDRAGKGKDCWPAVKTIASDLQLSRSTVKRAIHDLVRAELIEKEPRYRENGSNSSNRLTLRK